MVQADLHCPVLRYRVGFTCDCGFESRPLRTKRSGVCLTADFGAFSFGAARISSLSGSAPARPKLRSAPFTGAHFAKRSMSMTFGSGPQAQNGTGWRS